MTNIRDKLKIRLMIADGPAAPAAIAPALARGPPVKNKGKNI